MAIIQNARVGRDGRVTIPRIIRKYLGIGPGDEVIFRTTPGGAVIMETPAQVRERILRGVPVPDESDVHEELVAVLREQVGLGERRMRDLVDYLDNHAELAAMRGQPLPAWIIRIREIIGDHAHTPDTNTRDVPAILEALGTDITTALVALRRVRGAYERLEDLLYTGALDVSEDAQYARYFAWGSVISSLQEDAQRLREAFDTTTTTDGTPS